MYLFFDTETTGKILDWHKPVSSVGEFPNNFPRLVQLGFVVMDGKDVVFEHEVIVKPDGFEIPVEASGVHGITTERAMKDGFPIKAVLDRFNFWIEICDTVVGHNIEFDVVVMGAEFWRMCQHNPLEGKKTVCTMKSSTSYCKLPGGRPFKYPKLHELYFKLFGREMGAAHTALQDIQNTVDCYFALVEQGVIQEK